ncbi:head GIN domain-containing protein [Sphingomonas sp. Y38-1Y]|uniref:head GIN domain-containing protein n=1 Tax=Sphingomonas sp. Y38-1Y TaxID=3078265 RepID=UPI0028E60E7A|nr:head GIN domain-containing protein [Sphingomonas sp. Y38-1Y]
MHRALIALVLTLPSIAQAEERRVMVTSFERVRVEGPFVVEIRTGASQGAVARGDARALDGLDIRVEDRTLVVRASPNGWGGWPGDRSEAATIAVTTPRLTDLTLTGAGSARVDTMKGLEVAIALTGSGRIEVARVEADRLDAVIAGSGGLALAGAARTARLTSTGVGSIDAERLSVRDLTLQSESAGDTRAAASETARVLASGTGSVTVTGNAACMVGGSAPVKCGRN